MNQLLRKTILAALVFGTCVGSFAQAKSDVSNSTDKSAADKPKVFIQIPDKALKSGKVMVKDGSVYVRIGKERVVDDGSKAVELSEAVRRRFIVQLSTASPNWASIIGSSSGSHSRYAATGGSDGTGPTLQPNPSY